MRASASSDRGSYSVEGALALTVFTACLMALISILTVIKTEAEVNDAVHETAMELSQYSYVWGRTEYLKDYAGEKLPKLAELMGDPEGTSDLALTGPAVAKLLTKQNFPRDNVDEWLKKQGVKDGYEGLDFLDTQVLMDGKTIEVAVTYDLDVMTFGLRYFANEVRSGKQYGVPVKPGQGIDLYDAVTGTYAEVYSINVFLPTYATTSYAPRVDSIEKALFGYATDLRKDISGLGQEIVLADGSSAKPVKAERKVLILIVPEEVKQYGAMQGALEGTSNAIRERYGITVDLRYEQKALVKNGEESEKS